MSYPQVSTVADATAYLDSIGGSISRAQVDSRWVLSTGEQVLFEAETEQELDGFVLGFTLSQLIAARFGPIGASSASAAAAPVTTPEAAAADGEIIEGEIIEGDALLDEEISEPQAVPGAEGDPEDPTT